MLERAAAPSAGGQDATQRTAPLSYSQFKSHYRHLTVQQKSNTTTKMLKQPQNVAHVVPSFSNL